MREILSVVALGIAGAIAAAEVATAQPAQSDMVPGAMQRSPEQGGQQMMSGGMGQCMMHRGMGSGTMEQDMGRSMMMGSGMGSGMMQGGMRSGMGALFGSRVTPPMNLSLDDVRGYLALQLRRLNNRRLKIGEVKSDDGTITADIVTVDNSLVQRLKIDRHTGAIEYEN
ncbi:MAG: hypothetical protein HYX38_11305 [Rhodospirillales bacterium]|nr:hypothetical protein [Rhodospirillales bacterium]